MLGPLRLTELVAGGRRYTSIAMFVGRRLLSPKTIAMLIVSLLFSQVALANYLCPVVAPAPAMAQMMASGLPCEGMDATQPTLCHQHAADPGQVVQAAQVVAPSLPAIVQVLVVPALMRAEDAVAIPLASTAEAQPPPDPIFLSTLRLRV
jgi:hypothetical protein